ncbi:uncharacterized protein LOC123557302 isoform X1 [Mercenaria mercenaria]|uniref:uncharacterized protein LOC123557302 isoform X1 n=1 Tax=Mercenaria mercenaria TaxID=6596 RepID=UPI00234E50E9|nr:uncharacterized protein LOC123557302 isoform X1 [Mercenaria mercenaria]
MDLSFWRKIVVLAAVFQVSAAYSSTTIPPPCPKYPPRACISNSGCSQVKGQVCVGEEGSRFCRKCLCNKHSECNVQGNSLTCSCSEGYTGEYCECPPVQPVTGCADPYLVHTTECTQFSNETEDFLIFNNTQLTAVFLMENTAHEEKLDCKQHCLNHQCQIYQWNTETHYCALFRFNETDISAYSLNQLFHKFNGMQSYEVSIRKCVHC